MRYNNAQALPVHKTIDNYPVGIVSFHLILISLFNS